MNGQNKNSKSKKIIALSAAGGFWLLGTSTTQAGVVTPKNERVSHEGITVNLDTNEVWFGNGNGVSDSNLAQYIKEHAADISWVLGTTVLAYSGPDGHQHPVVGCDHGTGANCPQPTGNAPDSDGTSPDGDRPGGPVTGFVGGGGKEKGDSTPTGHVTGAVTGLAEDQTFSGDGGQPDETGSQPPADCAPNCGGELPNPDGDDDGGPAKRQGYAAQPTEEGPGQPGPAARQGLFAHPIDGNGDPLSRTGVGVRQGINESPIGDGDGNGSPIYRQGSAGRSVTQQVLEVFGF